MKHNNSNSIKETSNLKHYINLALEIVPVILFLLGSTYSIYVATFLLMLGSIVSFVLYYMVNKRVAILTIVLGIIGLSFGFLTLIFHNEHIIKIKVTVLDILIALMFFSAAYWRKNIMKPFSPKIAHRPSVFVILNMAWGIFFLAVAALNEVVWRNVSTQSWVYFKVFGIITLVIIFGLLQLVILLSYGLIRKKRKKSLDYERNKDENN